MTETKELLLQGYYKLAYAGFANTSHSPSERATSTIEAYSEELAEDLITVEKAGGDVERYKTGYIKKYSAWLGAKSRCISSFITGPANFPVRRAEKANTAERNKYGEFINWRKKVLHKITQPENLDIIRGSDGAIEKLRAKLETFEELQELMKATNKIVRDKHDNKELRLMELGITEPNAITIQVHIGFASYSLTNNGAKIRKLKQDIQGEENRLAQYQDGNKEYDLDSCHVIENVEANRLQLVFGDKPNENIRKELKRNGYHWSKRYGAWQRQLTDNALYSLKYMNLNV